MIIINLIKTFIIGALLLFVQALPVLIVAILFIGFVATLYALPLMLLWNWLMPEIFGLQEISFWQAFGLKFLSGIIFSRSNCNKDKKEDEKKAGNTNA